MSNKYFSRDDNLAEICRQYPELISVLVNRGFEQLADKEKRKSFGRMITLKQAAEIKQINLDKLEDILIEKIESDNFIGKKAQNTADQIRVEGLLPCPVKIPIFEELEKLADDLNYPLSLNLKSASQGLDWLKKGLLKIDSEEEISDIFISAGFDLFFDKNLIDKYRRQGVFKDLSGINDLNKDFKDNNIDLLDPEGDYSVIGVVPAVFIVNMEELGGRDIPKTWKDILSEEFTDSVSLPVSDFDLFNAILLNLYKKYGRESILRLGRSMKKSLHPAQMVKEGGRKDEDQPAVTIMPYFFTRMAKRFSHMKFVWPEDGAIISPIFMLSKKKNADRIKPLIDLLSSVKIGKILSEQGLFPSVLPGINNNLPEGADFMWPGWDFLRSSDPGQLLKELENEFTKTAGGVLVG
ncbi:MULTISPECIES: ABC transporter substrate-binding protein [unclassified Halanaerobium]|uniref:ABC transporter substrate-binding protein n=1 Tax=unclassified Halanaerobium TaxID=2641197 RepID=UPI000DF28685|nr:MULTISPECIES: ABC transporter substrate-binding protein [unclassified Halanaerobium]RCW49875.1 ABC-type Fe3+ transport system substrate-binding protein [Halanaerobium sp. MA284_MarDTE_T2]RCW88521.1 ABC-type Fe3+ transport system substrate-binding protein [Halanaerobium sp. DL-01]